jgi:4-amino-4-deoxy-L-arabinose transferase-like glycosyltransferase
LSTLSVRPGFSATAAPMKWSRAAVLALLLAVYLGSAFSPALMDDADSTHAEAAREMLVSSDYVTLHVNGVRYLEKAPLMYWLVALSYRIFGISELATRLPAVVAVLLTAMLAMRWATRAFNERAGIYAGLFTATTAGMYLFTRILIPEAILSLLIAASLYFFLTAISDNTGWRWYAGYACVALAVLTKGLVALVFAGAPAFLYLVLSGEWRRWREFRFGTGMALLVLLAAPWHLLAGFRNHGFFWFYFVNEHFLRFLGKRYPKDYNKLPAVLYWTLHLAWLFPWSMYLPLAVQDLRRAVAGKSQGTRLTFSSRTRQVCWLWAAIILVFFALSTNQEYYTFPAYFPILLLIAGAMAGSEPGKQNRWALCGTAAVAALSFAAGGALIAGLWTSRHIPYVADIGTVLAKHELANDTLSMSHMLDLSGASFAALRLPALMAVIALIPGSALALRLRWQRRDWEATWTTACAMALLLLAAHVALNRFEPYLSSKSLAQAIAQQAQPSDKIMIYGDQAFGSSLLVYLQRPIYLVSGRSSSMWFGSTFPDAPPIYLSDADLLREWDSSARVFLFVTSYQKSTVEALISRPKYVIAESSGKTIYSNRVGR